MNTPLVEALAEYGRAIQQDGWKAGEPLIQKHARRFVDFKKWAYALGIMLRAEELLDEEQNGRVVEE